MLVMRKFCIYLLSAFLFLLVGCGKKTILQNPVFLLQYNIDTSSYSGYAEYKSSGSNFQLRPVPSVVFSNNPAADSVNFLFQSQLQDVSGSPVAMFVVSKRFAKSQCDSTVLNWTLKSDYDFYSIFKTGEIKMRYSDGTGLRDGLNLSLTTSTADYHLPLSLAAYNDTTYRFEISEIAYYATDNDIDWNKLISDNIVELGSRRIMVKFNFRCKLYDVSNDSTLVTNGVFQSVFTDR